VRPDIVVLFELVIDDVLGRWNLMCLDPGAFDPCATCISGSFIEDNSSRRRGSDKSTALNVKNLICVAPQIYITGHDICNPVKEMT